MKYKILTTEVFTKWVRQLNDPIAKKAVAMRLARAEAGNLGDVKALGDGLSEMRIFTGKGYRIYYTERNRQVIVLVAGGDKSTQSADIDKAKQLLKELDDEIDGI